MNKKSKNKGLIIAIIFASLTVSGSLIFFGFMTTQSIGSGQLAAEIEEGIEKYIEKQFDAQKDNPDTAADATKVVEMKKITPETDHIRGNPDAKISLIEYSDYECPFCKRFHATAQQVVDQYEGEVNWVYRHFPLSFHDPLATQEALASECANELGGNDAFWTYTDLIFQKTKSNGRGLKFEDLITIAGELNLDESKFRECVESEKYLDHVEEDINTGKLLGVTGTPGNILFNNENGEAVLLSGAQPFYKFKTAIDSILK